MLFVFVFGDVFIFFLMKFILVVIRVVGKYNKGGIFLIVMNYIGDCLNFGFVVERVLVEGMKVEMVVVGEDCVFISWDKIVGRRGFCGIVFIYKVIWGLYGFCIRRLGKNYVININDFFEVIV